MITIRKPYYIDILVKDDVAWRILEERVGSIVYDFIRREVVLYTTHNTFIHSYNLTPERREALELTINNC